MVRLSDTGIHFLVCFEVTSENVYVEKEKKEGRGPERGGGVGSLPVFSFVPWDRPVGHVGPM